MIPLAARRRPGTRAYERVLGLAAAPRLRAAARRLRVPRLRREWYLSIASTLVLSMISALTLHDGYKPMRACVDIDGTKVAVSHSPDSDSPLTGRRSEPTATRGDNDAVARQIPRLIDESLRRSGRRCGHGRLRWRRRRLGRPVRAARRHDRDRPAEHLPRHHGPGARAAEPVDDGRPRGTARAALRARAHRERRGRGARGRAALGRAAGHRPLRLRHLEHRRGCGRVRRRAPLARQKRQRRPCRLHLRGGRRQQCLVRLRQRRGGSPRAARWCAASARRRPNCSPPRAAASLPRSPPPRPCAASSAACFVAILDLQRISLGGGVFWHNRDFLLPRLQAQSTAVFPC